MQRSDATVFSETDFESVLTGAKAGADWAWRILYQAFGRPLVAFLRAKGAPDPEDVAGEVFLQVVRDIRSFDGGLGEFRGWLYRIARNRLIDDARRRGARPSSPAPPEVLEAAGTKGDVEQEALSTLEQERVAEMLSNLSDDQRDVVLLRVLAGLSPAEVAAVLGKSQGTIRVLQHRALAGLRALLSQDGVTI